MGKPPVRASTLQRTPPSENHMVACQVERWALGELGQGAMQARKARYPEADQRATPVLMMRPHFCSNMCGRAALVVWNADDKHTAMISSLHGMHPIICIVRCQQKTEVTSSTAIGQDMSAHQDAHHLSSGNSWTACTDWIPALFTCIRYTTSHSQQTHSH